MNSNFQEFLDQTKFKIVILIGKNVEKKLKTLITSGLYFSTSSHLCVSK